MATHGLTDPRFVMALRTAIARAGSNWLAQPSHLRRRLEEELGSEAQSQRALVHNVVVAVDEQVPIQIRRNGWSQGQHDELVQLLIQNRGWTRQAAERVVATWAAALGHAEGNSSPGHPAVATSLGSEMAAPEDPSS